MVAGVCSSSQARAIRDPTGPDLLIVGPQAGNKVPKEVLRALRAELDAYQGRIGKSLRPRHRLEYSVRHRLCPDQNLVAQRTKMAKKREIGSIAMPTYLRQEGAQASALARPGWNNEERLPVFQPPPGHPVMSAQIGRLDHGAVGNVALRLTPIPPYKSAPTRARRLARSHHQQREFDKFPTREVSHSTHSRNVSSRSIADTTIYTQTELIRTASRSLFKSRGFSNIKAILPACQRIPKS